VDFPGMNGLQGVKILDYALDKNVPDGTDGCNSRCGIYLTIKAAVVNPSPFGLVIGEMNSEVRNMDGVTLGTVGTTTLTLNGNIENVITMKGKLAPKNLTAAAIFMSNYLSKMTQPTWIVGLDAGSSKVRWLQTIAKGLELTAEFPGAGADYQPLTDITVVEMNMTVEKNGNVILMGTFTAILNLPTQVNPSVILDVLTVVMQFDIIDIESQKAIGKVSLNSLVDYNWEMQMITLSFEQTQLLVLNEQKLEDLLSDLLTTEGKRVWMSGWASPHVSTNMGILKLTEIPFSSNTIMYGFNSFKDLYTGKPLMQIENLDIVSGVEGQLNLLINASVSNPSNIAPSMGKIVLQLWSDFSWLGYYIGHVTIDDFSLNANQWRNATTLFENLPAVFIWPENNKKAEAAARRFLSNYVSGSEQFCEIRGDSSSSSISILQPALANFVTASAVPGCTAAIIVKGVMSMPNPFTLLKLPTVLKVYNPFSAELTVTGAHNELVPCKTISKHNCTEYYPTSLGYYTSDQISVKIPPRQTVKVASHTVELYTIVSPAFLKVLFDSAGDGSVVEANGTMDIEVGGFHTQVDFKQLNIGVCLKYGWHMCDSYLDSP
jgi:hypothetical protein